MAVSSAAPLEGRRRLAGTWGSPWLREGAAIGCVLVAMAVVLAPLVFRGELPRATDTIAFYGPFASFLHDQLANGNLPLWNPTAFSGQPFAADAQSGVVYPPALLAFGLLSPSSGLVALTIFHYALAALGAYAFARVVGAGRLGSTYAAIAYGASGHLVARSTMLGLLAGVAWLPVCLAAAELAARARPDRRPAAVLLLALTLAGSILAGSQQLAAVAAISAGLWLLLRSGRRGVLLALAGVAAAALLAAVALLPRLELLASLLVGGGRCRSERHRLARLPRPARVLRAVRRQPQRADDAVRGCGDAGARVVRAARRGTPRTGAGSARGVCARVGDPDSPAGCSGRFRSCTASPRTSPCARWRLRCWPSPCWQALRWSASPSSEPLVGLLVACFVVWFALGFGDAWKLAFVLPLLAVALCLPALGSRTFLVVAAALLVIVTPISPGTLLTRIGGCAWQSASSVLPGAGTERALPARAPGE